MSRLARACAATAALLVVVPATTGCSDRSDAATQEALPPAYPVPRAQPATTPAPSGAVEADDERQMTTESEPAATPKKKTTSTAMLSPADRSSFDRLEREVGGRSGVAVAPLGLHPRVQAAGSLQSAIAWSTSKIPVAMAVIDAGMGAAQQQNLRAAITASDNAAAERLWSALGGGGQAAEAADEQLRAAGDDRTNIEGRRLRAGFTSFGQTVWRLTDQARFTAGMACVPAGTQVLGLMSSVVAGQRWGLGSAGVEAELKGGWGPGSEPGVGGGYLDRQMGVLTVRRRRFAVTIATEPANGSHDTGIRNLTAIARWVVGHVDARHIPRRPHCS